MKKYDTFAEAYKQALYDLIVCGDEVPAIRGRKTSEIINYGFCIKNPASNLVYSKGRKFSLLHAILESLGLFIPDNSVEFASLFNEKMKSFSDNGRTMHGSYGYRISSYIDLAKSKIEKDLNTRSSVINIYSKQDMLVETKDIPCTETIQLLLRDGKLNMIVNMRSNDVIWGTPYDVYMFTNLQMILANELGVELGEYYHNAGSFHLYEDMYKQASLMLDNGIEAIEKVNGNKVSEWRELAHALSFYASTYRIEFIEIIAKRMKDPEYAAIILKELEYRYGEETYIDLKCVKDYEWIKKFTKRWKVNE